MKRCFSILLTLFALFISCNKENEPFTNKYNINGVFQKGPFVKGTTILISELDDDLSQTGKTFYTIILDNKGSFEISDLELSSKYLNIYADGYFYNEINNELSNSTITLSAIVDVESNTNFNVNSITTLESERVQYLVKNGSTFEDAKVQARNEVYGIFGFSSTNQDNPETFNITQSGENNSILLAISLIILGSHSEAELTELISGIYLDIKTDGKLDDSKLQSALINEAKLLDINSIKNNIVNKYNDLGEDIVINEFDRHVNSFIITTNYVFTKTIGYPTVVESFTNIISDTSINWIRDEFYCIAADLPKGTSINVIIKPSPGYNSVALGAWELKNSGWTFNHLSPDSTNLQAYGSGQIVSVPFIFGDTTNIDFFIYENNSVIPTKTKVIQIQ